MSTPRNSTVRSAGTDQTEDVQHLKSALGHRAAKTVNNVLAVLSVMLRTAVEWGVIEHLPCSMKMLAITESAASFHDFDEYDRLVEAARSEPQTDLVVLLGGGGLPSREIMTLEWSRVDLSQWQLRIPFEVMRSAFSRRRGPDPVLRGVRLRACGASA